MQSQTSRPLFPPGMIAEGGATLALAAPIIAGFVGQMLMGWTDTIMVGRLGVLPLAACAFGSNVSGFFLVFGFGLISAVSIRVSQEFGAGRSRGVGDVMGAGMAMSFGGGVLLFAMLLGVLPFLGHLGQPPEVVGVARVYILYVGISIPFVLLIGSVKAYCEALSRPWLPFYILLGGVILNVFLNWVFIYGNLGAPALGLEGAGLATLIARVTGAVVILVAVFSGSSYAQYLPRGKFRRVWNRTFDRLPSLLRLGLPSGLQVVGEISAFTVAGIMMGWIGVAALAAHQIAITCAGTTFMVPLGLATALTVRVGQARGAGEKERLRAIVAGALLLAVGIMILAAALFFFMGTWIARIFVDDMEVVRLAALLLVIAGIFQIFDGVQIVSIGGLRGLNDVRFPMAITYANYWGVALPLCWLLAFPLSLGAAGVWWGLCIALLLAAVVLAWRLARMVADAAR